VAGVIIGLAIVGAIVWEDQTNNPGSGDEASVGRDAQAVSLHDSTGDVEDGNGNAYPDRGELDLSEVIVSRDEAGALEVTFRTAMEPAGALLFLFVYYSDPGQQGSAAIDASYGGGNIEVRREPDGSLRATAQVGYGKMRRLRSVSASSNEVTVVVPAAQTSSIDTFDWRATVATVGRALEVSDDAPDAGLDATNLADFP
jgi:hypothetical protein